MIKEILNYPGYFITDSGQVWSEKNHSFLSQSMRGDYLRVSMIDKDGNKKWESVHRLVALAFIDNPYNLPQVNHKDEDKLNNHVSNLEWVSVKENANYGTRNQRIGEANKIKFPFGIGKGGDHPEAIQIAMCDPRTGEIIQTFPSIADACHFIGKYPAGQPNISAVLNGRRKTAYQYFWKKI